MLGCRGGSFSRTSSSQLTTPTISAVEKPQHTTMLPGSSHALAGSARTGPVNVRFDGLAGKVNAVDHPIEHNRAEHEELELVGVERKPPLSR
jgi:hypothetical protein